MHNNTDKGMAVCFMPNFADMKKGGGCGCGKK